jgi:putative inorganic carbon (HCO3(-)) transporter
VASNSISVQRSTSRRREPLAGAYVWLLLFMAIYCARPEDWVPGLMVVPLAKITGILALIALLLAMGDIRQRLPREIIYLILLMVQLWLTVPFSPVWRGGAFQNSLDFSKVVPIVIVMVLAVNSLKRLRYLVFIQCASVAVIAGVAVWRGRAIGGRLEGVLNGNYANPNDLAFAIVLSLPLCLVLAFVARNKFSKAVWAAAMAVMAYAVFLTASRGGFVCIIVATAICLWEFSIQGRRRYLIPVVALAGIAFWAYAGGGVSGRFNSALHSNSNEVEDSAYGSAQARWGLFTQSLKLTARYPLFGVGTGNFVIVSGSWHATHNAFTQMSSEGGVPAFLLFVLILWCGFRNINATKGMARGREPDLWASGFRASLGAFIVGSFFASEAYQFFTYFLVGYTTVLGRIAASERVARKLAVRDSSAALAELGGSAEVRA